MLKSESLVKYTAFKSFKDQTKSVIVIQICLECVEGTTLDIFVQDSSSPPEGTATAGKAQPAYAVLPRKLVSFASQLLQALNLLHRNQISHGHLKPSSIYLAKDGVTLRVSDFGLVAKINALCNDLSDDKLARSDGDDDLHVAIKCDIFELGKLLSSLRMNGSPAASIGVDFDDFFNAYQQQITNNNKIAFDCLLQHRFMQSVAGGEVPKREPRIKRDFTDIERLGEGSFGEVFSATSITDKKNYAIKQIGLKKDGLKRTLYIYLIGK